MLIETIRFGALDLKEDVFIHFPWGIPGFEDLKRYVLLDHRTGPFQWLQAVDNPEVAFVVCSPDVVGAAYQVPLDQLNALSLQAPDDLVVLVMISFERGKKTPKLHLGGPLLFNAANRQACQWTIDARDLPKFLVTTG
jgi:flagellar assembly factor FliW